MNHIPVDHEMRRRIGYVQLDGSVLVDDPAEEVANLAIQCRTWGEIREQLLDFTLRCPNSPKRLDWMKSGHRLRERNLRRQRPCSRCLRAE